jgi:putative sigma-54 modulation protein
MKDRKNDVILSSRNLNLSHETKQDLTEKFGKLFSMEDQIIRIRLELEHSQNVTPDKEYVAKGHVEIRGPDLIASFATDDLYKSVDKLVQKLARMLRRRSTVKLSKRSDMHGLDIPASLPKTKIA